MSIWSNLFKKDNNINKPELNKIKESPYDQNKHIFNKQINDQIDKAIKFSGIPLEIVKRCESIISNYFDDIFDKTNILSENIVDNYAYKDNNSDIYLIVSVFQRTTNETVSILYNSSKEKPFGYWWMLTTNVYNNWPSTNFKFFVHLILCKKDNFKELHMAMGDYGGSPTAHRKYTFVPISLLNTDERKLFGL